MLDLKLGNSFTLPPEAIDYKFNADETNEAYDEMCICIDSFNNLVGIQETLMNNSDSTSAVELLFGEEFKEAGINLSIEGIGDAIVKSLNWIGEQIAKFFNWLLNLVGLGSRTITTHVNLANNNIKESTSRAKTILNTPSKSSTTVPAPSPTVNKPTENSPKPTPDKPKEEPKPEAAQPKTPEQTPAQEKNVNKPAALPKDKKVVAKLVVGKPLSPEEKIASIKTDVNNIPVTDILLPHAAGKCIYKVNDNDIKNGMYLIGFSTRLDQLKKYIKQLDVFVQQRAEIGGHPDNYMATNVGLELKNIKEHQFNTDIKLLPVKLKYGHLSSLLKVYQEWYNELAKYTKEYAIVVKQLNELLKKLANSADTPRATQEYTHVKKSFTLIKFMGRMIKQQEKVFAQAIVNINNYTKKVNDSLK